jgi:ABC-type multidrug transport system permease subunit
MNRLKKHWGIKSNSQIAIIILVFACNGTLSAFINRFVLATLEINKNNLPKFTYWIIYILFLTIIYFFLLAVTSRVFGQVAFFRNFTKKSLKPLGLQRFIL